MRVLGNSLLGSGCALFFLIVIWAGPVSGQTVLVPDGSDWKYLDDGSNQGTAWRDTLFNDSSWDSGPAQLGARRSAR